jgi:hypothetical protein
VLVGEVAWLHWRPEPQGGSPASSPTALDCPGAPDIIPRGHQPPWKADALGPGWAEVLLQASKVTVLAGGECAALTTG